MAFQEKCLRVFAFWSVWRTPLPFHGGSYISQNDLRVHFGLGKAARADLEIRWPSGVVDKLTSVPANQVITAIEGKGIQS